MPSRRVALSVIALGLGLAAAAQVAAPLAAPPLYDGVVVVQPYVYVNPPAGKPGGSKGASAHVSMNGPKNAVVALATPEQPPQAQIVAGDGTLVLPPSSTAIDVSITPLNPSVEAGVAGAARILGNVYAINLIDQNGVPATAPASGLVTVVLRAPEDAVGAQVGQVVDGAWLPLKSEPMFGSTWVAVVTSFGDFAVIVPGTSPASPATSGAILSSVAPTSPANGAAPSAAATPAATAGAGSDAGSSSEGFPSARVIGAVAFLLLLGFIGAATVARVRRDRKRRR
jgi:hypothetical protein